MLNSREKLIRIYKGDLGRNVFKYELALTINFPKMLSYNQDNFSDRGSIFCFQIVTEN